MQRLGSCSPWGQMGWPGDLGGAPEANDIRDSLSWAVGFQAPALQFVVVGSHS